METSSPNKLVDGVPYLASIRDLSMGGIYLNEISEPMHRADARVAIEMMLPGQNEVMWLETDVVRHEDGRGTGLVFKELTERTRRGLTRFLEGQGISCQPASLA